MQVEVFQLCIHTVTLIFGYLSLPRNEYTRRLTFHTAVHSFLCLRKHKHYSNIFGGGERDTQTH
jgi:hypothetical protein